MAKKGKQKLDRTDARRRPDRGRRPQPTRLRS